VHARGTTGLATALLALALLSGCSATTATLAFVESTSAEQQTGPRVREAGTRQVFDLTVAGARGRKVVVAEYTADDGRLVGHVPLTPGHDASRWATLRLFVPVSREGLFGGPREYRVYVHDPDDAAAALAMLSFTRSWSDDPHLVWRLVGPVREDASELAVTFDLQNSGMQGRKAALVLRFHHDTEGGGTAEERLGDRAIEIDQGVLDFGDFQSGVFKALTLHVPFARFAHLDPLSWLWMKPRLVIDGVAHDANVSIGFYAGGPLEHVRRRTLEDGERIARELQEVTRALERAQSGNPDELRYLGDQVEMLRAGKP
jgi:hypothetical protein